MSCWSLLYILAMKQSLPYFTTLCILCNKYQIQITSLSENPHRQYKHGSEGCQFQLFILSTVLLLSVQFFCATAASVIFVFDCQEFEAGLWCFFIGRVWLHTGRQALPARRRVCQSNFEFQPEPSRPVKTPVEHADTRIFPFN